MEHSLDKLERSPESHKGQNGKVGVIAGSKDYAGAPAISAKAALRTGADLTHILTSRAVKETVAGYSENFIVSDYSTHYFSKKALHKAKELAEWSDTVVIGPGMSQIDPETVQVFLSYLEKPSVIDADAIKPAPKADLTDAVLTPHSGEAEVIRDEFGSIEEFVNEKDAVVVLKGPNDRIYSSEGVEQIEVGTSGMTIGGTGDALTGVIASLISQGLEPKEAAKLGVWINGKAGERASEELGNGMIATDLIEQIPYLLD
jgi:NAD(P)H-hydrate epimerase